jgi:ketosteroid isomerase-like protein
MTDCITPPPPTCYNKSMTTDPTQDEASIRAARAHSNRSIARRNLLGVGDSLAENFVAIIGDGTFVPSRAAYLKLFKQGFDAPKTSLTYERIPDTIQLSTSSPLAAEQGHWIATDANGKVAYTGTYMAMWEHTHDAWKIRSELYVNLSHH